jgi:hypothetical protein
VLAGTALEGKVPCNGAFPSATADGSDLQLYAWGLRSDFDHPFSEDGQLISSQNSCDALPPRPVFHGPEAIYEVEKRPGTGLVRLAGLLRGHPDHGRSVPRRGPV